MSGAGTAPGAAIVLAGGRSARMGRSKASLEWEGSTLLRRTVATLACVTRRVIVVRAAGQALPPLPAGVAVVEDALPGRGPLEGMLAGLRAMDDPDGVAFVCATDMPLLHPCFVRRVTALIGPADEAAVPDVAGRLHPLAGAYRGRLAARIADLPDDGRRSLTSLIDACAARRLDAALLLADPALAAADPRLDSLLNVNTPEDLSAARDAQPRRANRTGVPAAPSSSSPSQASAVAPASDVTA